MFICTVYIGRKGFYRIFYSWQLIKLNRLVRTERIWIVLSQDYPLLHVTIWADAEGRFKITGHFLVYKTICRDLDTMQGVIERVRQDTKWAGFVGSTYREHTLNCALHTPQYIHIYSVVNKCDYSSKTDRGKMRVYASCTVMYSTFFLDNWT